jgi:hypothetical protein
MKVIDGRRGRENGRMSDGKNASRLCKRGENRIGCVAQSGVRVERKVER